MTNTGHFWTPQDEQDLITAWGKKRYGMDIRTFCEWYAPTTRFTDYAIDSKVHRLLRTHKMVGRKFPKVLLFDIETLPLSVYVWGLKHNDYISSDNIITDWSLSCWSAKWLLEPEMFGAVVTPQEARDRNDERILKPLWKLINRADVVVGQNSNKFDIKKINTRFLYYGMGDTMPFVSLDTLTASRQKFDFSSYKLDYMNKYLHIDGKSEVDMEDFRACARGDKKALAKMFQYNKWDVQILEEFYMRVRSYIKHPNFAAWSDKVTELEDGEELCSVCQGVVTVMSGTWVSPAGVTYEAFRCPHCSAIGRKAKRCKIAPRSKRA